MALTPAQELELLELEAEAYRQQQAADRSRMTHRAEPPTTQHYLRDEAAAVFGVPPSAIDLTTPATEEPLPNWVYRAAEGMATDTAGEETLYARKIGMPGRVEQVGDFVGVQAPGSEQVRFINTPGLDRGDFAHFVGGAALPLAAGVATGTRSPWVHAGVQMGVEAAKEGVQKAFGIQDESPISYGTRMGLAGVGEAVPYAVARGLSGIRSAFAKTKSPLEMTAEEVAEAVAAIEDFGLDSLMMYQKSGSPVVQKLASQVLQLTEAQRPKVISQLQGTQNAIRQHLRQAVPTETLPPEFVGPPQPLSPDYIMQQQQAQEFARRRDMLQPKVDPNAAGQAASDVVKRDLRKQGLTPPGVEPGGLEVYQGVMGEEYDKLRAIASDPDLVRPRFDISRSQAAAGKRKVVGTGKPQLVAVGEPPTVITVREKIDVAKDAPARVQVVRDILNKLDPEQDNFEVLKELRSELGNYYNRSEVALAQLGVDKTSVDKLYGALSEDMIPVNADEVPEFVAQRAVAEDAAIRYYGKRDLDETQKVLSALPKKNPARLWDTLASDPKTWSPAFQEIVEKGDPKQLGILKHNLRNFVMDSNDPVATLERFRKEQPEALRFAFGDQKGYEQAMRVAQEINALNTGLGKKAADMVTEQRGFALVALKDRLKNPAFNEGKVEAATRLVRESGGPGSNGELALRNAALEEVYRKALKINPKYDVPGLDPTEMERGIKTLKDNGWWEGVLTARDRARMKNLQSYAKRTWETGDTGTALTVASQVGKLRGGSGLSGMTEASVSIRASQVLSSLVTAQQTPMEFLTDIIPFAGTAVGYGKSRPPLGQGKLVRGLRLASRILRQDHPLTEEEGELSLP